jgi:hypothetical protein
MTQEQARIPPVGRRRSAKQYVAVVMVLVAVLAAAGAISYYGEEIGLFMSLGGWNRGVATEITQQFIDHLQAGKIPEAVALVDPNSYKPYEQGGKQVGLEHDDVSGRGRYNLLFDELIPPGKVELGSVTMTASDGGGFIVPARFADGTEGWFVVGKVGDRYLITSLPMVPGRFHY